MDDKKTSFLYKIIYFLVRLFYRPVKVVGAENLPEGPCIVVGNHCQIHGPLAGELYFPGRHYIWCAGEMMHLRDVPGYAFQDFWSRKPRWCRWFFRLASYAIAPLSVCIFNNAHCIGVYRDGRILSTFRQTLEKLAQGNRVIIFPEHDVPRNNIVYEFQDRFIGLGKAWARRTGEALSFVPMYLAPTLHTMYIGKPIPYDPEAPERSEISRIREALADAVTAMGRSLPEHRVVPYPNLPKKLWLTNLSREVPKE